MKRIIARLDVKGGNVVRGINLEGLRIVGKPHTMACQYFEQKIDEIIYLDIVASLYGRNNIFSIVEETAKDVFVPLTVGGGIRSVEDAAQALRSGADKITINSAAVRNPKLISEIANEFGSQCVVAAIEAKRTGPGAWTVLIENGRESTGLDAIEWTKQVCHYGAGEILITSIDQDGMRSGFDIPLTKAVCRSATVPVIASGGPGSVEHIVEVFKEADCDAVALGTCIHFNLLKLSDLKDRLASEGFDVRRN